MDNYSEIMANSDGVSVHAGFPNPAIERRGQDQHLALDINQLLIRHPSSTYVFRISGHLWADQGVHDGDIAVIDRSLTPRQGDLILTWQESGFSLSRHGDGGGQNESWGIVTATVHQLR